MSCVEEMVVTFFVQRILT